MPSERRDRSRNVGVGARLLGFIRLVHPFPVATVLATSSVLLLIAHRGAPSAGFLARALAVVLLTQIPVATLNDLIDREDDRLYQPSKPIPSGLVSLSAARALVIVSLVVLFALSTTFGLVSCLVIWIATAGGVAYDLWLKPTPFSIVGYMIGFLGLALWIWLIAGHLTPAFVVVAPAGALLLLAGHLAQSFPDLESDRAAGGHGLAVTLGPIWTLRIILLSYLAALAAALVVSVGRGRWLAIVCCSLPTLLAVPIVITGFETRSRAMRMRLFYLIAPGLGALAVTFLLFASPGT